MKKKPTADQIADMADRGEDVTKYMGKAEKGFAEKMRLQHIQRTNVDFGLEMLSDLDQIAEKLNISRQAVVKMAMQEYLIRYHLAFDQKKKAS